MKLINKSRRTLYRTASILGDINALASGKPKKIIKRYARKRTGRFTGKKIRSIFR